METKSNHRVNVVRINEIRKHPNADSLGLVDISGYQVVVRLDEWKVGDLGAYVQPDSVLPERPEFAWFWEDAVSFGDGPVPEKRRRVTVRRFRKEWSEGLLIKIPEEITGCGLIEGQNIADQLGITHYDPPEPVSTRGEDDVAPGSKQRKRFPRSWRGWWYWLLRKLGFDVNYPTGGDSEYGPDRVPPIYDVEALKNYANAFEPGEEVVVTEKIHGSNARFLFDGKRMHVGSRKLWKKLTSDTVWNKCLEQMAWIQMWCMLNPNYVLFGEVVPTQGKFKYGCEDGQVKFFVFDVLSPSGKWMPSEADYLNLTAQWVPILYHGPFDLEKIKSLVDGPSTVQGAKHLREGVVIRPVNERQVRGLGRLQLKIVSNQFLEKDSK